MQRVKEQAQAGVTNGTNNHITEQDGLNSWAQQVYNAQNASLASQYALPAAYYGTAYPYQAYGIGGDGSTAWANGDVNLAYMGSYTGGQMPPEAIDGMFSGVSVYANPYGQGAGQNYYPGNPDYAAWNARNYNDAGLYNINQRLQGMDISTDLNKYTDNSTSSSVGSYEKKTTWASIASKAVKPVSQAFSGATKKKGPGMPPPPVTPSKIDIGSYEGKGKPPVAQAPPSATTNSVWAGPVNMPDTITSSNYHPVPGTSSFTVRPNMNFTIPPPCVLPPPHQQLTQHSLLNPNYRPESSLLNQNYKMYNTPPPVISHPPQLDVQNPSTMIPKPPIQLLQRPVQLDHDQEQRSRQNMQEPHHHQESERQIKFESNNYMSGRSPTRQKQSEDDNNRQQRAQFSDRKETKHSKEYSGDINHQNHKNVKQETNARSSSPVLDKKSVSPEPSTSKSSRSSPEVASHLVLEKLKDKNNYNPSTFDISLKGARFFVIKSYSEDDIHRSIKYEIWCSTEHGNRRLDDAFRERERNNGVIYLLFSVNTSGYFCGVARMLSSVDYGSSSSVWAQDKWKGQFKVRWIYVKDVPNAKLRHIRLENNENKPVTNSRDVQEVPLEKGVEVLKIIHSYHHTTSIFDDFVHYEKKQEEEVYTKKTTVPYHPPQPPAPHHQHNHSSSYRPQYNNHQMDRDIGGNNNFTNHNRNHNNLYRGRGGGGGGRVYSKNYSRS